METPAKRKPLSNAEKIWRYHEKRKNDLAYKQLESKRIEKIRKSKVLKMTVVRHAEYQKKAAERKRKSCAAQKKKEDMANRRVNGQEPLSTPNSSRSLPSTPASTILLNPYSTKQSFGKAVARCRQHLPISPHK